MHSIQVSPKGDCLLSAGRDIRLWDLQTKEILQVCFHSTFFYPMKITLISNYYVIIMISHAANEVVCTKIMMCEIDWNIVDVTRKCILQLARIQCQNCTFIIFKHDFIVSFNFPP